MTCDKCNESRVLGDNFCPYCGMPLNVRFRPKKKYTLQDLIFISAVIAAVQGVLALLYELVTGWAMIGRVFEDVDGRSFWLYYITPHIEHLFKIDDLGIKILYIAELLTVTVCIGIVIIKCARQLKAYKWELKSAKDTEALEIPVLFGILLLGQMAMIFIMMMMGFDFDSAETDSGGMSVFQLMNASVYEELLCRLLMLGLPCLIVALLLGRKDSPKWKYLLGGAKYERWMIVFVVFSAAMFGAAHLDNWGTWKFFPTFAFGLIAGYLFLKYGLHATIALHFLNDFLMSSEWLMGSQIFLVLGLMSVGLFSLPYIWVYAARIADAVKHMIKGSEL